MRQNMELGESRQIARAFVSAMVGGHPGDIDTAMGSLQGERPSCHYLAVILEVASFTAAALGALADERGEQVSQLWRRVVEADAASGG